MDLFGVTLWLLFAGIFLQALRSILGKSSGNLPPGPTPLPIIGNLLELGDKPHKSLAKLAMTHGPIMSLKIGQTTTIVISSAAVAKEVHQKNDRAFSHRTIPASLTAHNHHLNGLIWLPPAARWRNLRKILYSNIFSPKKLDANQHLTDKNVEQLVAEVRESSRQGTAVEIGQAVFKTTLNLLSNIVFSADLADPNSDAAREFRKTVEGILIEAGNPNIADCFRFLAAVDPQGARRRMGAHFKNMYDIFGRLINQRLEKDSNSNDFLDDLLQINGDKNQEEIKIECLLADLFAAGIDTTANTVEWAIAELLQNPDKLQKARTELEQIVGIGNAVKESDISKLPYLQAVVKESMRLHPVVALLLPRKAEEDVEICGYVVPKGAQVLVNAWAIGRDPTTWEDPESFVPERLVGSEIDVKGRDFELIPFGAGRRICPGMPLGIRIVHLMVASLIHGFEWKLLVECDKIDMEDKFGLTLSLAHPIKAIPVSLPYKGPF